MNHGSLLFLNLLGSIALLLWATRQVRTGMHRAFGDTLRGLLQQATRNAVMACLLGLCVATALQSSTATALILVSFVARGLMSLSPALAVMLGADFGSTLVVQFLSYDLRAFIPLMLLCGVAAFMLSTQVILKQIGRITIGLAFMIMSLGMIVGASSEMRESGHLALILLSLIHI